MTTREGQVSTLLMIVLFLALLVLGIWEFRRYRYLGLLPAAIILVVLIIMLLTGNFNVDF